MGTKLLTSSQSKQTLNNHIFRLWCALIGTLLLTSGLARAAQPHLKTFWGHARVELGPPAPGQWPEIRKGFSNLYQSAITGKFLDLTVAQATKNSLVAVEVACWFYIGEIIGRRSLIGYKV